jgi:antitoxin PrlF
MTTATMTTKGQVTLPKRIRQRLGLQAGDKVVFEMDEERNTATLRRLNLSVKDTFGLLSNRAPAQPVAVDDMRTGVKSLMAKRAKR